MATTTTTTTATTTMPPPSTSTATTTAPTTSATPRSRRAPVPLLLEAFPVPPSHIPPTPTTPNSVAAAANANPPPTGPPTTPLPPVPGPSRISEHEQLLLLSSAVNRSRRSSKYSTTSSASQRESVVSVASSGGHGSVHGHGPGVRSSFASSSGRSSASTSSPLPPPSAYPTTAAAAASKRDSTASSGGTPHSPILTPSSPLTRSTISISLSSASSSPSYQSRPSQRSHRELYPQEEGEEQQLTRMSMSPIPLSDIDDDDAGVHNVPPAVMPTGSPTIARAMLSSSASAHHQNRHHQANESISSIDMHDVLGVGHDYEEDEEEKDFFPPPPAVASPTSMSFMTSISRHQLPHQHHHPHHQTQVSLADPIDPQGLLLDFAQIQRERQGFTSSTTSSYSHSHHNHNHNQNPSHSPTSTKMLHNSSSSIGSFSYPSSSKKSPVTVLAPFAPASPKSTSRAELIPRLPPASPYAHTYPAMASVLDGEEKGGVSASVSTMTQISASSSVGGMTSDKDGVGSYARPETRPTTFSSILTGTFDTASKPTSNITPTFSQTSASAFTPTTSDPLSPSTSTSTTTPTSTPSIGTVKDSRMERRAERTRSAGLKKVLGGRSRSRNGRELEESGPEPNSGLPPVPGSSTVRPGVGLGIGVSKEREREVLKDLGIAVTKTMQVVKGEIMTLDELGPVKGGSGGSAGDNVGADVMFPSRESLSRSTTSASAGVSSSGSVSAVASTRTPTAGTSTTSLTTPKPVPRQHPPPPPPPESSRTPSPDITTILNSSASSRRRSKSRPRAGAGVGLGLVGQSTRTRVRSGAGRRHVSEGTGASLRLSAGSSKSSRSWDDRERERGRGMGMGRVRSLDQMEGYGDYEGEHDEELERVLEGEGSEDEDVARYGGGAHDEGDSDSSLDLHTPLPHLMVRHGLLSPNSKLLPGAASRATTPMAVDGRPGSIMSVASNGSMMTKSGIIKDERDTPMRRVRHRDGKMLRGGIGLTTGLGWSDSEDEDAPSPLTRRLSSLNLSRRSSASSLGNGIPSRPSSHHQHSQQSRYRHPLSRSYSSGALTGGTRELPEFDEFDEFDDDRDDGEEDHALKESREWAQRQRVQNGRSVRSTGGNMAPPTSWQRRTVSGSGSRLSSGSRSSYGAGTGGDRSSFGTAADGDRTSKASFSSVGSMLSTTEVGSKTPSRVRAPGAARDSSGSSGEHYGKGLPTPTKKSSQDDVNTTPSSTASTLSIPMPLTPRDLDPSTTTTSIAKALSEKKAVYDKEKSLPPLPAGGLKMPSHARMDGGAGASATKIAFPRARAFSSMATTPASSSAAAAAASSSSTVVRPLQLPRQAGLTRGTTGDRPAVPVPSVLALSPSGSRSSLRTPSSSALHGNGSSPTSPLLSPWSTNEFGVLSSPSSPSLSLSTSASTSTTGIARPKPRTGTGMVYRTSSSVGLNSKMRAPMALSSSVGGSLKTGASTTGGGIGNSASTTAANTGSIGRSGGIPRAIVL
ncbi:hypothetical protein CVT25_014189 [Psilocybe cyanescens]|uniref:Uncharacterized protein n=1 Tax=Psilocybe cyanescens TaxID=93625 RepID=A0A409XIC2_PSICY|nr:hypothetical protein CVT25_014189 [Psilocybe cyanescens]